MEELKDENIKEQLIIKYRISLNKRLYEKNIITLEVYQKMENFLINKLSKNI